MSARRFFIVYFLNNDKNILKNDKKLLTNDNYCGKTTLKTTVLEEFLMWNKSKSITLTHLLVRACYVFLAVATVGLPKLMQHFRLESLLEAFAKTTDYVILSFWAVVPAGYVALICLDKLLDNVKKEMVFNGKNVKLLRIISWACFYAGFIGVVASALMFIQLDSPYDPLFALAIIALAVAEMFMGLVVRVVKNVFEAAIEIKEENELTI